MAMVCESAALCIGCMTLDLGPISPSVKGGPAPGGARPLLRKRPSAVYRCARDRSTLVQRSQRPPHALCGSALQMGQRTTGTPPP
jgi:hypothetical protein